MIKSQLISPFKFVAESMVELKKVVWPTKQQVIKLTLIVIGASVATGVLIGALDYLFSLLIGQIIK